jgi:iron complex outermembrane receptor protein
MQFLEEDPVLFGEGISNAPKARVYGLELESDWLPTQHLRLNGSVSWLQGEFTKDYLALDPRAAEDAQRAAGFPDYLFWTNFYAASVARENARRNIDGNSVPKLPRWQGNLALTYTSEIGSGTLTARAQYVYRGSYEYRLFNDGAIDKTPSYDQVNLMLSYGFGDTGADVTLRVTNLFDDNGINSRFSDPYGSAQVMETFIPPRQVSVLLGYKF